MTQHFFRNNFFLSLSLSTPGEAVYSFSRSLYLQILRPSFLCIASLLGYARNVLDYCPSVASPDEPGGRRDWACTAWRFNHVSPPWAPAVSRI